MIFMLLSFSAYAIDYGDVKDAGFDKLTVEQKSEILKLVSSQSNAPTTGNKAVQVADSWLNIGERIGRGFSAAAKELGVAVNEFATTPVGKLTIVLIVWNLMGGMVIHVIGAVFFLFTGMLCILFWLKQHRTITRIYSGDKVDIFGRARLEKMTISSVHEERLNGAMIVGILVFAVSIIMMVSY